MFKFAPVYVGLDKKDQQFKFIIKWLTELQKTAQHAEHVCQSAR